MQEKKEVTKILIKKETLSSAKMVKTMEQRDATLGKSDVVLNEKKLAAGTSTNITPINTRNSLRPIKEYQYNDFERCGRLS